MRFNLFLNSTLLFSMFVILAGCISTYPRYEKLPCSSIGEENRDDIRKIILANGYKEKELVMTSTSVQYHKKKVIEFSEISKVVVVTKGTLKGKRYTLVTVMKSREKHAFETFDYKLAISVYSTLECLAGIKPKQSNQPVSTETKYDKLEKLKSLYDSGALNAEEYEAEKKKVLDEN